MKTDVYRDPLLDLMEGPQARLAATFGTLPPYDSFVADSAVRESIGTVLDEVADRMGDNYPYFHPLYTGQMMKPPHPVARAAYAMAINRFGVFSGRPELDIVVWQVLAESAERRSALAQGIFNRTAELDLHLALVQLPDSLFATRVGEISGTTTCLRSVLMKPEHEEWLGLSGSAWMQRHSTC